MNSAWFHIHQLWKVIRIIEAEIAWCHRGLEAADGDGELLFNTQFPLGIMKKVLEMDASEHT